MSTVYMVLPVWSLYQTTRLSTSTVEQMCFPRSHGAIAWLQHSKELSQEKESPRCRPVMDNQIMFATSVVVCYCHPPDPQTVGNSLGHEMRYGAHSFESPSQILCTKVDCSRGNPDPLPGSVLEVLC
jgi:hypothetical protein